MLCNIAEFKILLMQDRLNGYIEDIQQGNTYRDHLIDVLVERKNKLETENANLKEENKTLLNDNMMLKKNMQL